MKKIHHTAAIPSLPERLAAARAARQLTLKQLAEITGLPLSRLSEYEGGKRLPSLEQAAALGDALGIDIFPRK